MTIKKHKKTFINIKTQTILSLFITTATLFSSFTICRESIIFTKENTNSNTNINRNLHINTKNYTLSVDNFPQINLEKNNSKNYSPFKRLSIKNTDEQEQSNFETLTSSLTKSSKVYKDLFNLCKKEKCEKTLAEYLQSTKGFESYVASGQIKISKGISGFFLEKFIANLLKMIKAPGSHQNLIASVISEIEFFESLFWNNFKIIFDSGKNNEAKFVSIFAFKRDAEKNNLAKYDFVYLDFTLGFKLKSETLVIVKSNLPEQGNKWSEDEYVFCRKDNQLAWNDVKMLFNYFSVVAFKSLGNYFNV